MDLTTPALLFPALSLLLLAYTNRFLALASLIRTLHQEYSTDRARIVIGQIRNLQRRISLIKVMQIFGVLSLLLCVVTMFLLFFGLEIIGDIVFALSLISMIISLVFSLSELFMSVTALNLQLSDLQGTIREE
ncbi:hypothetical protein B4O97_09825 [Marispirochaeta aestuarii]|uniref:II family cellulose-binding protein n=2 Tax=Marispirochaeta aestuarii TaxID=1963862 RepID=A0A1Y1RYC8_9SPIO|nr:hypothetical protein B4O97_09825 [Marispirochaeta aestuarii]